MGILQRFSDVMRSNINALLDKCEDPAKMADQMLLDARRDLAEVKKETAVVMANETAAKRRLEAAQNEASRYATAAQNAVRAGNDNDARALLTRKQQLEADVAEYQKNYDAAKANADKMRQMHNKLTADINSLESRRDVVKAKVATAKAQENINKATSAMKGSRAASRFADMEARADRMLDEASAMADLNAKSDEASELADKYVSGAYGSSVDDELARMKAEMGLST